MKQSVKELIMPPLVLTVICAVVCGLLVTAHDATYVDNTGVITEKLRTGCEDIFSGGEDCEYEMLVTEEDGKRLPVTFGEKDVDSIIVDKAAGNCLIEYTGDGYKKDGLHILVGFGSDGAVSGISFISIGETPGLGTKVQEDSFTGQFIGYTAGANMDGIDGVTAATYSSKGMKAAVVSCAEIYSVHRGEIFGGE
ncbi:MAG: FMN-binding protein [Ruminococcus sp.]|nr:FMN-binding protein [Ruminococcus sp.]